MEKEFTFTYRHLDSVNDLNETYQRLIEQAQKAKEKAYSPYSHFKVGAALLLDDETYVIGNNQENKAYPSGLCAERVALFSYGANKKDKQIKALAIVGAGDMISKHDFFTPCGACRQAMSEYTLIQGKPFEIIIQNFDGSVVIFDGIHQLLPFAFGDS